MMSYGIHSKDYKKSVIEHYLINGSLRKTCKLFKCHKTTLYNWIIKDINKMIRKDRIKIYDEEIREFIIKYTKKNVISTLQQIQREVKNKYNVSSSLSFIYYLLESNDTTRKRLVKKYFPAKKKNIEKDLLKQFYKNVNKYDCKKIICLDETSVYINMLPSYGRSHPYC